MRSDSIKYLTVAQLKAVLDTLPDDHQLSPNTVGNLKVRSGAGEYIGYIDFLHEGAYESITDESEK